MFKDVLGWVYDFFVMPKKNVCQYLDRKKVIFGANAEKIKISRGKMKKNDYDIIVRGRL